MLFPVADSRLFVADTPSRTPGTIPATGWIEIGETEALGLLGVQWGMDSVDLATEEYDGPDGYLVEYSVKTALRRPPMQIIMGNDPSDSGQSLLWAACRTTAHYPFRIVMPDGGSTREWTALVFGMTEVFDAANNVMRLQADLKPTSAIQGSEV